MTKFKKRTLCFLTAIIMIVGLVGVMPLVSAGAETSGDFEYEVLEDGTAEITGYTGDATEINIPSEIAGKKVTSIGSSAFENHDILISITIPNGVTSIGSYTFYNCDSLTNVSIPDSITRIGHWAFYSTPFVNNQTTTVKYVGNWVIECDINASSVVIKNGTVGLGDYACHLCRNLTDITIPNSVTSIGEGAFNACDSLKSITIPNSVMEIGKNAFGYHIYYGENYKIDNLIIYCYSNTVGEQYAIDNGFDYILLDGEQSLGDLSGDGQITTADVGIINSFARGVISPTPEQLYLADANGDGEITTVDVGLINKIAKGV